MSVFIVTYMNFNFSVTQDLWTVTTGHSVHVSFHWRYLILENLDFGGFDILEMLLSMIVHVFTIG